MGIQHLLHNKLPPQQDIPDAILPPDLHLEMVQHLLLDSGRDLCWLCYLHCSSRYLADCTDQRILGPERQGEKSYRRHLALQSKRHLQYRYGWDPIDTSVERHLATQDVLPKKGWAEPDICAWCAVSQSRSHYSRILVNNL